MGSIRAVTVPRWGMTMTEGTICSWMAAEGDAVTSGQELIEIETTKITNVVEAPGEGILRRVVLAEGTTAPVGALAGVIASAATSENEIDAFVASYADRMGSSEEEGAAAAVPRTITIRGHKINRLESGPASGDTVVFLHGFGGDLGTWLFNQPVLSENVRTIAFDLPGHGGSDPLPDEDAFQAVVEIIGEALETLVSGRIHLIGHSFGGGVAAAVAADKRDVVASLALIAPVGLGRDINRSFLSDFVAADRRRPLQGVLERLFADPSKMTGDMVEGVLRFKRLEGVPEALTRVASSFADDSGQRQSIGKAVSGLECPVLVIWGEADAIIPLPAPEMCPTNAVFRKIAGVGHMPQMEAAAEVNAAILENITRAS